jgi:hypothetical protein
MNAVLAHACLLLDVLSMKVFVWMLGQNGELLDSHLFFFDRYSDLANYHRQKGRIAKADRLAAIAEVHFQAAPDDDEPPEKAAAMGMPVPPRRTSTDAVSTTRVKRLPSERSNDLDVPTDLQNLPQVKSERRSNFMNKSSYCQR